MPRELGARLRTARGTKSIEAMAGSLSVNKNTLGGYERGERLPDVDFLATFAQITGSDFFELLSIRLLDSDQAAARALAAKVATHGRAPVERAASAPIENALMNNVIIAVEELMEEMGKKLKPAAKAEFILKVYELELIERGKGAAGLSGAQIVRLFKHVA